MLKRVWWASQHWIDWTSSWGEERGGGYLKVDLIGDFDDEIEDDDCLEIRMNGKEFLSSTEVNGNCIFTSPYVFGTAYCLHLIHCRV